MGRVLAISSQVVRGHVGLSAVVPALQRLGHEVLAIPTVILSNHPGHSRAAGIRVEVNTLISILDVLDANGWLAGIDAVLTGYLPTAAHVEFAATAIERANAVSQPRIIVDPVAGDDPRGLFIADDAAELLKSRLVPLAHVLTPNRFELEWLSGVPVVDVAGAMRAAAAIGCATVVATSIPEEGCGLADLCFSAAQSAACRVERRGKVPKGTGDLLSGLLTGHLVSGHAAIDAMARAVGAVQAAIMASTMASDLVLTGVGADDWSAAPAAAVSALR